MELQTQGRSTLRNHLRVRRTAQARRYAAPAEAVALGLIPAVIGLLIWQVISARHWLPATVIPSPHEVFTTLQKERGLFFHHAKATGFTVLFGYAVAIGIGIPLGWLMVTSRVARQVFYPSLVASQAIPKIALGPIFVLWLGFGSTPKVVLVALLAVFPITIGATVGFETLDPPWYLLVKSMGANRIQIFTKLQLPAALPSVFGGLKIAAALAVVGATVGEFIGADKGLAYLLLIGESNRDLSLVFASLIALSLLGVALYVVVCLVEMIAVRGKRRETARGLG